MVPRCRCQLQGPSGQREGVLRRAPAMRTKSAGVRFDVVWGRFGGWRGSDPCNPRRCHRATRPLHGSVSCGWVAEVVRVRVCRSEPTPSFLAAHVSGTCPGAIICRRAQCSSRSQPVSTSPIRTRSLVPARPPCVCLLRCVCVCLRPPRCVSTGPVVRHLAEIAN